MKRLLAAAMLAMFLCLSVADGQTAPPQPTTTAKLLCVYEARCICYDCLQEYVNLFISLLTKEEGTFALCVRSDRPLALALANGNLSFKGFPDLISQVYGSSNPVIFLRRKTGDPAVSLPEAPSFPRTVIFKEPLDSGETTEIWFIPKGAAIPPHTESIPACRFHFEEIDELQPVSKRLRMLTDRLRERPAAYGVVRRYFGNLKKPSVKRLQKQTNAVFARAGISADRALVGPYSVDFVKARTVVAIAEVVLE
jgi:hypothetical protein